MTKTKNSLLKWYPTLPCKTHKSQKPIEEVREKRQRKEVLQKVEADQGDEKERNTIEEKCKWSRILYQYQILICKVKQYWKLKKYSKCFPNTITHSRYTV